MMIEDVTNAEVMAVTSEVVPFVNVNAVTLVCHDLLIMRTDICKIIKN